MNSERMVASARKKIDQIRDASDVRDLVYRHGVASGWIAALRLEKLIDAEIFQALTAEVAEVVDEVSKTLPDE
ncbi:hypothetical protein thsps117_35230 [Pseudomonas sp. No.117]